MKILHVGDIHLSGKNPSSRIDNYLESIFEKLDEIKQIAKNTSAEITILTGDIFHSPLVSNIISDRFIDYINTYPHPIYTIWGNHDLNFGNLELSKATSLAHVFRRSKLKPLTRLEIDDIFIVGMNYKIGIEEEIKTSVIDLGDYGCTILVPHAMFVDKVVPFMSCLAMEKYKIRADFVLCSHNHTQYGIKKVESITYVAPGALSRGSIAEEDVNRRPAVAIIDTKTKQAELRYLQSAKLAQEIFDLEKIKLEKTNNAQIELFLSSLNCIEVNAVKFANTLQAMFEMNNVPEDVKQDILRRL